MKLYWQILKLLFRKAVLRRSTGTVVRDFAMEMGIVYIKLAQILATQNYGKVFTEADRVALAGAMTDSGVKKKMDESIANFREMLELV